MSLFQRAADAIESFAKGAETDFEDLVSELRTAHASHAALLPGDGRRVIIQGTAENGYLVEAHDGSVFSSYGVKADGEAGALHKGLERFGNEPRPEAPVPALAAPEPAPLVSAMPQEEHPERGDLGTVDITRGRPSDEFRDLDGELAERRRGREVAPPVADTAIHTPEPADGAPPMGLVETHDAPETEEHPEPAHEQHVQMEHGEPVVVSPPAETHE